jgi:4-hydroxy-3-polyprenylbenzoate decarboxylase
MRTQDDIGRTTVINRQSMRGYMTNLEQLNQLIVVREPVSLDFEIAACLIETAGGPAIRFDAVGGHTMPVVGNLLNSPARMARGIGVITSGLQQRIVSAIAQPLEHRIVKGAPCQEVLIKEPVLTDELPVPRFFEFETGPYITAGAIVAKDRQTGKPNLSIARLKPLGGNRALVGIAPNHHLAVLARAAQARGETLDIAVCIGNHPAVLIASCLYLGLGDDELKIAGALIAEPLDVARCIGTDLLVPAHCECVLEGTLDADELVEEGTVSEFHGTYLGYGTGIVASFARLTRRHGAVFQVILPGYHPEHCLLGGVAIAAGLARTARASVPAVHEVAVGLGGAGRFHAVVSLKDPRPGDARKAMFSIWSAVNLVKRIVVVDEDVDPWDAIQVEWAIATRSKADRDILIVPGVRTDRSDPLATDGVIAKVGIDATKRSNDRSNWRLARPPAQAIAKAHEILGRM